MSFTPLSLDGKKYESSLSPSLRSTIKDVERSGEEQMVVVDCNGLIIASWYSRETRW